MLKKLRKMILPCILLSMVGALNTKNATFVTHEARTRMLQKENENFRKMSEDSECDDIIDKYDFYRFDQQDMHYLVADTFSDENSPYLLARVILTPESYYYSGNELVGSDEKIMEVQTSINSSFSKTFYSLSSSSFTGLINKAKDIDDSSLYNTFVSAFHLEFDELSIPEKSPKRMPQLLKTDSSKTDYDTLLDNYLACQNKVQKIRLDYKFYPTFDDAIVSLLGRDFFTSSGERNYTGLEWGYYVNTKYLSDGNYSSEVFVYDIDTYRADTTSFNGMRIVPVVNKTYLYDSKMDRVIYLSDSNLCIVNPRYTSAIRYFDIYEPYEDGDDVYYNLVGEHVPNIGDKDYLPEKDFGASFVDDGFILRGQLQDVTSDKWYENAGKLVSFLGEAASILIDSLHLSSLYNFLAGAVLDIGEIITKKYFESQSTGGYFNGLGLPCRDENFPGKYVFSLANMVPPDFNDTKIQKQIDRHFDFTDAKKNNFLLFKDSNDEIRYFSTLAWSNDERSKDVNIMISNRISFDIYNDTSGTKGYITFLKSVEKNISYRCPSSFQSGNVRCTSNVCPWFPYRVSLDKSSDNYTIDFNCKIIGKYRFFFYDLPANLEISLNNSIIFNSGEKKTQIKVSKEVSVSRTEAINGTFEYVLNAASGNQYQFVINRKKYGVFQDACFFYTIMMLGNFVSFDSISNKHGENSVSRSFVSPAQTTSLPLTPKYNGVYTLATQCTSEYIFFITDEFGIPLCDNRFYRSGRNVTDVYLAAGKKYYLHFGDNYNEQKEIRFELYYVSYCPNLTVTLNKKARFTSYDDNYLCFLVYSSYGKNVTADVIEGAGKVSIKVKNLESGSVVASGSSSTSFYIQADIHYLIKIDISKLNNVQKSIVSMRIH